MVSITLSTPLTHHSISAVRHPSPLQTPPSTAAFVHTPKLFTPHLKSSSLTSFHRQAITSSSSPESLLPHLSASMSQALGTAMDVADGDVMGLLLKERIVFLGSVINDFVADAIIGQLLLLDVQDPTKDIRLFINCPGGSLSATMGIFDVVRLVRADISTVAIGASASTATIILGGGTKGKRFAMPNARIMIQQPLAGFGGRATDAEVQARDAMDNKTNVIRIISDCTGQSFEQVEKDMDKDHSMCPIEAVEYGLIDGVIERDSIIPLVPVPDRVKMSVFNFVEVVKDPKKFLIPEKPDDEIISC